YGKTMEKTCGLCGKMNEHGGELWLGGINDKKTIKKMLALNKKRKYKNKEEIEKFLSVLYEELEVPYFFDTHAIAKVYGIAPSRTEDVIKNLKRKGFGASRTHFCPTGFKTDANIKEIVSSLK
ncbi:MAG: tRNA (guanine(10)-N(2))-dimethyltransferase, partial [Candidatus Micrarchaeia archaeon]